MSLWNLTEFEKSFEKMERKIYTETWTTHYKYLDQNFGPSKMDIYEETKFSNGTLFRKV